MTTAPRGAGGISDPNLLQYLPEGANTRSEFEELVAGPRYLLHLLPAGANYRNEFRVEGGARTNLSQSLPVGETNCDEFGRPAQ